MNPQLRSEPFRTSEADWLAQTQPAAAPLMPSSETIRNYDRNGPRYTSYPTALQFSPRFGPLDHRAAAARANAEQPAAPLSMYVHIPFCASPCFYCGCTKVITRQTEMADAYLLRLEREIELQGNLFPRTRRIEQLHFGGGTPTFMPLDHLSCVLGSIERHFNLSRDEDREFSIEIDPRTVDAKALSELAAFGFNRVSLGIQDFDPAVQRAVNREQSLESVSTLVDAARRIGFRSLSMDLIYGLPLQTVQSFGRTLDQVIALRPQRLAAYSYAHLPQRFRPQKKIDAAQLPSAEVKLDLLRLTVERLLGAGYVYIGMDHFALPDDELALALAEGRLQRNFQGYSTRGGLDLVGIGMSAISQLADSYSQNARSLPAYDGAVDAGLLPTERGIRLSADDRLRRDVIAAIMCRGVLRFDDYKHRYGVAFREYFSRELAALELMRKDGLVEMDSASLTVAGRGRYLLRAIAMPFDAYLQKGGAAEPNQPAYSRVV